MSESNVNSFTLVVNLLSGCLIPLHVIMGLFEVNETIGHNMTMQQMGHYFQDLSWFALCDCISEKKCLAW